MEMFHKSGLYKIKADAVVSRVNAEHPRILKKRMERKRQHEFWLKPRKKEAKVKALL